MKKITLLLFSILYSSLSYGQYLSEGFESGTSLPDNWVLTQTNTTETWEISNSTTGSANNGTNVATVSYNYNQDETLTSPSIDLSSSTNPRLIFSWNMSYYWSVDPFNNYDFTVSLDDGTNVTELFTEADAGTFINYTWYEQTIDLSAYVGQSDVKILFNYTGDDGAALYLDDILIEETPALSTATNTLEGFSLYPTIVKEELNFRSQNNVEAITVFNILGQKVFSGAPNTNNSSINLSNLRPGVYVVKVSAEGKIGSYKIIKE